MKCLDVVKEDMPGAREDELFGLDVVTCRR